MKWQYLALLLLIAPAAYASDVKSYVNVDDFLRAYNEDYAANRGICNYKVGIHTRYDKPIGGTDDFNRITNMAWPSDGSCPISATSYKYRDSNRWQGTVTQTTPPPPYDITMRAALHFRNANNEDEWIGHAIQAAAFNQFTRTTLAGKIAIPITTLAWCGEAFQAEYTTSTVVPSRILLTADHDDLDSRCSELATRTGMTGGAYYSFYHTIPNEAQPFTLPYTTACGNYSITVTDRSHDDWPTGTAVLMEVAARDVQSKPTAYTKKLQAGDNYFEVLLELNAQKFLNKITVTAGDESKGNGGTQIKIHCLDPVDPDQDLTYCTSPAAPWLPAYGTAPANACCGDDADDNGRTYGEYTCQKTTGSPTHTWRHASTYCEYPQGWEFGTGADTDPKKTYMTGGGCCSDPTNFAKNVTWKTEESICTLTTKNESRWMNASLSHNITLSPGYPQLFVSNSTRWLFCNATSGSVAKVQQENVIAPQPNAGACTAFPDTCTSNTDYQNCMAACEDTGCMDTCRDQAGCDFGGGNTNCQQYNGTFCTQGTCACPAGQTWNNDSCVAYTPTCPTTGYTVNATSGKCERYNSTDMGRIFTSVNICNTAGEPDYICLTGGWRMQNSTQQYLIDSGGRYIANKTNLTWKADATRVCEGNATQPVYRKEKPQPQARDFGFCKLNQCYLENYFGNDLCVASNNWTYAYLCDEVTATDYRNTVITIQVALDATGNGNLNLADAVSVEETAWRPTVTKTTNMRINNNVNYTGTNTIAVAVPVSVRIGSWNDSFMINRTLDIMNVTNGSKVNVTLTVSPPITTTEAAWTTRTQLIADLFYEYVQNNSIPEFVLNCDKYQATLNDPSNVTPFATQQGSILVNEFCVLSDNEKALAIGVSLNDLQGKKPVDRLAVDVFIAGKGAFLSVVNDSSSVKFTDPERCSEASEEDGNYHACATDEGNIWYNAKYGTLVLSAGDFELEDHWYDSIRKWWNGLFRTTVGSPLVSLNAEKVFIAREEGEDETLGVQGSVQRIIGGTKATIVYQNINATAACNQYPSSRLSCGSVIGNNSQTFQRVEIINVTQQEWQAFTLAVRP